MKNKKIKELLLYVVFGVLTTAVNFVVFIALQKIIGKELYLINNAIAWVVAVAFAFVTNKLFVFESKSWKSKLIFKEILEFVVARLFSLGVEELGMFVFVDLLGFSSFSKIIMNYELTGETIAKIILAFIVVILNYFFSKFIIFKKKNA